MELTRRGLLFAGAIAATAGCEVLGGPFVAGSADQSSSRGVVLRHSFHSEARRQRVTWSVSYPPGHEPGSALPVVLALPGRHGDDRLMFTNLHGDHAQAAVIRHGYRPFAIVSVGGGYSYWHKRANGDDPQRMLRHELLPRAAALGLRTGRIAVFGWSMGGYGAILLAERWGQDRISAIAADSPALWTSPGATAPGAFDDAADYHRNDVYPHRYHLAGRVPVRIAIGTSDPFYSATRHFVHGMSPRPKTDFGPGGHYDSYWRTTGYRQLRFLAHHL